MKSLLFALSLGISITACTTTTQSGKGSEVDPSISTGSTADTSLDISDVMVAGMAFEVPIQSLRAIAPQDSLVKVNAPCYAEKGAKDAQFAYHGNYKYAVKGPNAQFVRATILTKASPIVVQLPTVTLTNNSSIDDLAKVYPSAVAKGFAYEEMGEHYLLVKIPIKATGPAQQFWFTFIEGKLETFEYWFDCSL